MVGVEAMKAMKGKPKAMKKFVKAINRKPSAMKEAVTAKKAMKGRKGDEGQQYEDERAGELVCHVCSRSQPLLLSKGFYMFRESYCKNCACTLMYIMEL